MSHEGHRRPGDVGLGRRIRQRDGGGVRYGDDDPDYRTLTSEHDAEHWVQRAQDEQASGSNQGDVDAA